MKRIKTLKQLKANCKDTFEEFFILLNYNLKSSKTIEYLPTIKIFNVINEIDNTRQTLTEKEIINDDITNIGKAIRLGSFYKY